MFFQWYLFLLLIMVAFFTVASKQQHVVRINNNLEKRVGWGPVLILLIPMVYLAATRGNFSFGDTLAYKQWFSIIPSSISELKPFFASNSKDKGFSVISIIIKSVIGDRVVIYFGIIAAITLFSVMKTYKDYSCNFLMSLFLFIASGEYIQWNYNGIRQFIPVAILFSCLPLILSKKYFSMIIIILLLSTIHASALLMIPVIFIVQGNAWNKKTLLFAFVVILSIAYLDHFTNIITTIMENTQYSNEVDQFLETQGTNALRVAFFSIPTILSLCFLKYIKHANSPIINMSVNMSIISLGIYVVSMFTSGIFIGRIPVYFSLYNYILIPWLIENIFDKDSSKFVYLILLGAYMVFYYYQIHITWGL